MTSHRPPPSLESVAHSTARILTCSGSLFFRFSLFIISDFCCFSHSLPFRSVVGNIESIGVDTKETIGCSAETSNLLFLPRQSFYPRLFPSLMESSLRPSSSRSGRTIAASTSILSSSRHLEGLYPFHHFKLLSVPTAST